MIYDVYFNLKFDIKNDKFEVDTNIKQEEIKDIIDTFLRMQVGKGKDNTEPNKHDVFEINLLIDLSCDGFTCTHNCGNLGLREGILMHYLEGIE